MDNQSDLPLIHIPARQSGLYLGILGAALLTGCGSSSSSNDNSTETPKTTMSRLTQVSNDAEFSDYLKEGLKNTTKRGEPISFGPEILDTSMPVTFADDAAESVGAAVGEADFSTTNIIENGVDEADLMKFDGEILYVVEQPSQSVIWAFAELEDADFMPEPTEPVEERNGQVQLFQATLNPSTTELIAKIDVASPSENIAGLYLHGERDTAEANMISITSTRSYGWGLWANESAWGDGVTRVQITNVSDPHSPTKSTEFSWQGHYVDSRRVGDMLYIVSRFTPNIEGLEFWPNTTDAEIRNEQLIEDATLDQLLPTLTVKPTTQEATTSALLSSGDCFLTTTLSGDNHSASIVTITSINLSSLATPSSVCTPAFNGGFYASTTSLYLSETYYENTAANDDSVNNGVTESEIVADDVIDIIEPEPTQQTTAIHKFDISNGDTVYKGSGSVSGYLGWNNAAFRMSEHSNQLRVISTTVSSDWSPVHHLSILEESSEETASLTTISQLPNSANPAPIGKPNEDIYAVRFLGDKGYVVTFERIDPLYILDLADSQNPTIAGELEVPGFSTYLQLLDEDTLMGIGSIDNSAQISVFDVSDANNPTLADSMTWSGKGTSTAAEYDYKAVTFLHDTESSSTRLALPMVKREDWQVSAQGAQLLEVNRDSNAISDKGFVNVQGQDLYGVERTILHGEGVHYLNGTNIWSAEWDQPEQVSGPSNETESKE